MNDDQPDNLDFFDHWTQLMQQTEQSSAENVVEPVDSVDIVEPEAITHEQDAEQMPIPDAAGLSLEGRQALVMLMQRGVVLAAEHPKVFEHVQRHQGLIRARLDELFLQLMLDERDGVAFIRQRPTEDDEVAFTGLVQPRTLTLFDTLVLLVLRKHYQERENAGEQRIIVDLEQLEAGLMPFLPLTSNSRLEKRQLAGTLTRFKERKLVREVRGEDGRFEITPVLRHVVNADFLQQMLSEYRELAETEVQTGTGEQL